MRLDLPHILIVDDDKRILQLINDYLIKNNFRISTADNALKAREKIENIEFAIPKQYQDTNSKNNHLGIRPEKMYLSDDQGIEGEVYGSEYLGSRKILTIQSFFGNFKIRVSNDLNANLGSNVKVNFESKSAIIFDGETENALKSGSIN